MSLCMLVRCSPKQALSDEPLISSWKSGSVCDGGAEVSIRHGFRAVILISLNYTGTLNYFDIWKKDPFDTPFIPRPLTFCFEAAFEFQKLPKTPSGSRRWVLATNPIEKSDSQTCEIGCRICVSSMCFSCAWHALLNFCHRYQMRIFFANLLCTFPGWCPTMWA